MKRTFFPLLCSCLLISGARAGEFRLQSEGVSPDGRLCVVGHQRSETNGKVATSYRLIRRDTRKVLLSIPASYELERAKDAQVYWNPNGTAVAINEPVLHHGGNVFIVAIRSAGAQAEKLNLSREEIVQGSGRRWSKARIGVPFEAEIGKWISNDQLRLYLAGFAYRSNDPDELETINLTYAVVVQIIGSKVVVANVSKL